MTEGLIQFLCLLLYAEADIASVVEGIVVRMEGFGGLEVWTVVEWVPLALVLQGLLAFFEGGMEERITVGGEDNLVRLEVERDGADVLSGNGETIDHTIGDVLVAHGFNHAGNDDGTGYVVATKVGSGVAFVQQSFHLLGTHSSQFGFVRLGVVVVFTPNKALAVANHPYFTA